MNNTASPAFDQASGLRELFAAMDASTPQEWAPELATVHAFVCPSRPALSLPFSAICSQLLQQEQQRHVWIDELDFQMREDWPIPRPVRFDLAQSMASHVPLSAAVQRLGNDWTWYASARRLPETAQTLPLVERLAESGLSFARVLVSTDPHSRRRWSLYGPKVKPVLICEASHNGTSAALTWLRTQASEGDIDLPGCAWIMLGDRSATTQAQETVDMNCRALYGNTPQWLGVSDWSANDALLPLAGHWQSLARGWIEQFAQL